MDHEVTQIIMIMETLLANDDRDTAWALEREFARIWDAQAPYSAEREAMAKVWELMRIRWG